MKCAWLLCGLIMLSACEKKATKAAVPETEAEPTPTENAGKETAPPPDASVADGPANSCDDQAIQAQVEAIKQSTTAYLERLIPAVKSTKPCAAVTREIVAMESHINRFVDQMKESMNFGKSLSETCRQKAGKLGDVVMKDMQVAFPETDQIDGDMKTLAKRCKNHPGFKEAVSKIKFMKKN